MLDSCLEVLQESARQFRMHNGRRAIFAIYFVVGALVLAPLDARSQNRVDLDDLNIKGELLNDNRLRMSSRDPHRITDRVSYRNNFRKEITDGLEINWPDANAGRGPATDKSAGGEP